MGRLKRLLPDALAGRIVLLLVIAILVANVIALIVLSFQQQRFDRQASEDREIERISALIRRRMIWNSLADFGAEGWGASGSGYAA